MYQFRDTIDKNEVVEQSLSESLIINGKELKKTIPQILTTTVTGRDLVNRNITKSSFPGQNGETVEYVSDQSKDLNVGILVRTKSSKELVEVLTKLNEILSGELKISFNDDPLYHYIGYLEKFSTPPEGELNFEMEASFFLPRPYKFSNSLDTHSGLSSVTINSGNKPVLPETITLKDIDTTMKDVTIGCNGKQIKIATEQNLSGDWVLDFKRFTLKSGTTDRTERITWDSDVEDFKLKKFDKVTCNNPKVTMTIVTREMI